MGLQTPGGTCCQLQPHLQALLSVLSMGVAMEHDTSIVKLAPCSTRRRLCLYEIKNRITLAQIKLCTLIPIVVYNPNLLAVQLDTLSGLLYMEYHAAWSVNVVFLQQWTHAWSVCVTSVI